VNTFFPFLTGKQNLESSTKLGNGTIGDLVTTKLFLFDHQKM